jgi:hypothetical protein
MSYIGNKQSVALFDSYTKAQSDNVIALNRRNRNLLINGGFNVWQRGVSQTSNGYGSVDRWYFFGNGTNKSVTQTATGLTATQDSGSGVLQLLQGVEWDDYFKGKTLTLSFKAQSTVAVYIAVRDGALSTSSTFADVLRDGLTLTTPGADGISRVTVTIPETPSGTPKMISILLAPNTLDTSATSSLVLEWVQLEEGSVATPFEYRSYGEELALCQRYYWRIVDGGGNYLPISILRTSDNIRNAGIIFPTTMRAAPAVSCNTTSGAGTPLDITTGTVRISSPVTNTTSGEFIISLTADAEL